MDQPYSVLNHFKIELVLILLSTHNSGHIYVQTANLFRTYAETNNLLMYKFTFVTRGHVNSQLHIHNMFNIRNYTDAKKEFSILLNTTEPRKYMNTYLKNATRTATANSTVIHKQLEPNEMSLTLFTKIG